jgi:hypothetical protein
MGGIELVDWAPKLEQSITPVLSFADQTWLDPSEVANLYRFDERGSYAEAEVSSKVSENTGKCRTLIFGLCDEHHLFS